MMTIFKFIKRYIDENDYPPTYKEIMDGCNLTDYAMRSQLHKLEDMGYITRKRNSPRSIRIVVDD